MPPVDIEMIAQLLLAVVLGILVGAEREIVHKPAGLRTHALVSLGACLFTIISVHHFNMDPARIAAGIVAGIGFIGAGSIICLLYTSPSPRDRTRSRMPSSA